MSKKDEWIQMLRGLIIDHNCDASKNGDTAERRAFVSAMMTVGAEILDGAVYKLDETTNKFVEDGIRIGSRSV